MQCGACLAGVALPNARRVYGIMHGNCADPRRNERATSVLVKNVGFLLAALRKFAGLHEDCDRVFKVELLPNIPVVSLCPMKKIVPKAIDD